MRAVDGRILYDDIKDVRALVRILDLACHVHAKRVLEVMAQAPVSRDRRNLQERERSRFPKPSYGRRVIGATMQQDVRRDLAQGLPTHQQNPLRDGRPSIVADLRRRIEKKVDRQK